MLANQLLAIAFGAVSWVLVARVLGVGDFGRVAATSAVIAILAPAATLGRDGILFRRASRDAGLLEVALGHAASVTLLAGSLLGLLVCLILPLLLPEPLPRAAIAAFCCAELLLARIGSLIGAVLQIIGQYRQLLITTLLQQGLRLAAAVLLSFSTLKGTDAIGLWAMLVLGSATAGFLFLRRCLHGHDLKLAWTRHGLGEGSGEGGYFVLSGLSRMSCSQIDKAVLAREWGAIALGPYAAASRFIDAAMQPLLALAAASYARYFRAGAEGLRSSAAMALRLLPFVTAYGLLAGAALVLGAPLASRLLGPGYESLAEVLIWLAPLPLLRGLQYQAGGALTGAGRQHRRALLHFAAAVLNLGLNLWLVPGQGWQGAAIAALVTDLLYASLLWGMLASGRAADGPRAVPDSSID